MRLRNGPGPIPNAHPRRPFLARYKHWRHVAWQAKVLAALVTVLTVLASGLVATASTAASAQSSSSTSGSSTSGSSTSGSSTSSTSPSSGPYACVGSGGLLLESAVPCDYGSQPPALLNEVALSSGLYAATPAQQASLSDFEQQAIADTISDHDLSSSDVQAVESWGRDDAEAELWALIEQAVEDPAASLLPASDVQNVTAWFSAVVQRENVEDADDAGLEYAKWAGLGASNFEDLLATNPSEAQLQSFLSANPAEYGAGDSLNTASSTSNEGYCDYVSPAGAPNPYTNNVYQSGASAVVPQQCFTNCDSPLGCSPPTPSYNSFVQWGATDAIDDLVDSSSSYAAASFGGISRDIAEAIGLYASLPVAGVSAAVIASSSALFETFGTAALAAFTNAGSLLYVSGSLVSGLTGGAVVTTEGTVAAAASVAAGMVAGLVAIVILAIVIAVIETINVVQAAQLPGQLAQLIAGAPTQGVDLASMFSSSSQVTELYLLFVGATMPAPTLGDCDNGDLVVTAGAPSPLCLNAPPVAPQSSSDPGFLVTEKGSSSPTASRTISWADAAEDSDNTAYLSETWFVDDETSQSGGGSTTFQSLRIHYTDWSGDEEVAWLVGNSTDGYHFVTINDAAASSASSTGETVSPSTCAAQGICSDSPSIDYVGTDGQDYSASVVPAGTLNAAVDPSASILGGTGNQLVGSSVTFTADASSPLGLALSYSWCYIEPNGGITLIVNGTPQPPSCAFTGTGPDFSVTPDQAGTATVSLTVTDPQDDSATATTSVTVDDTTSTSVAVSPASAVAGQAVTYTATVSPGTDESGLDLFSGGKVSFVGPSGEVLCANVALASPGSLQVIGAPEQATCTTTYTTPGPEAVTAYYGGSAGYATSSGSATTTVGLAPTKTEVSVTTPPGTSVPVVSEPFNDTATVELPPANTTVPTGTVNFSTKDATLCAAVALSPEANGTYSATCPAQASAAGAQPSVTATYSGDSATTSSAASTTANVSKEQVSVELSASTSAPAAGQAVTYSAVVSPEAPASALDLAGGTVSFSDSQGQGCSQVVPSGVPATSICTLTYARAGAVSVVAQYSGDANTRPAQDSATVDVGAVAPGAPGALTATAGSGGAELTWQPPTFDGGVPIEGYYIYQGTIPGGEGTTPVNASLVAATHYAVAGLAPAQTYYFTVAAVTPAGTSAASAEAAVTLPAVAPGAPGALSATAGVGTVALAWAAPSSDGGSPIEGYDIYQGTSPLGPTTVVNTSAPLSATASTLSGLTPGTTYYFRVEALNAVGRGPGSAVASATPLAPLSMGGAGGTGASGDAGTSTTGTTGTGTTGTGTTGTGTTGTGTTGTGTTGTGTTGTAGPSEVGVTSLPPAQAGTAYSTTLSASGGQPPYTWSVVSGTLPPGLSLDPATGVLAGTPAARGTWAFTLGVSASGVSASAHYSLSVAAPALLASLTTVLASSARFGQAVTVAAEVAPTDGPGTPTGTVSFSVDGTSLGAPVTLVDGTATARVAGLSPGAHQVSAGYSGDGRFASSLGTVKVQVGCSHMVSTGYRGTLRASGTTCVMGATIDGAVHVAPGATLALFGATVTGPVVAAGAASAMVCASTVSGPLTVTGATGTVEVGGPAGSTCGPDYIDGQLAVLGATGPVRIGQATVSGPVLVMADSGGVSVAGASTRGDLVAVANSGWSSIQGDTVQGDLTASWGTGPLELSSDHVGGTATVSFNSASASGSQAALAASAVSANTVGGGLDCEANTPAPVDYGAANHVTGRATGQCAKLG